MIKTLSAAAIAISLIAGPVLAQGYVSGDARVAAPAKVQIHKGHLHKASVHKARISKVHVNKAHVNKAHRHFAHVKHVKKFNKHVAKRVTQRAKHGKPLNSLKRIKQDKLNTAG